MDEMLAKLVMLGTDKVSHINGSLLCHLRGTYDLLKKWGNRDVVCNAGLYHSIYGTAGFAPQMVSLRQDIVEIIGNEAEQLVYLFATCDRDYFYPQIGRAEEVEHQNRLSGEVTILESEVLRDLLEVILANELEIVMADTKLVEVYRGYSWEDTFDRFKGYVSSAGFSKYQTVFGIKGVKIVSLKLLLNEKGRLMEVQRNDDEAFPGFGQAYVTSTRSGVVKAWYQHQIQTDQIASVTGNFLLVLFDSQTGRLMKITMEETDPKLVQIPPSVWHGFKNIGDSEGFLLHLNTIPYNLESPDEKRLDSKNSLIPFNWDEEG